MTETRDSGELCAKQAPESLTIPEMLEDIPTWQAFSRICPACGVDAMSLEWCKLTDSELCRYDTCPMRASNQRQSRQKRNTTPVFGKRPDAIVHQNGHYAIQAHDRGHDSTFFAVVVNPVLSSGALLPAHTMTCGNDPRELRDTLRAYIEDMGQTLGCLTELLTLVQQDVRVWEEQQR